MYCIDNNRRPFAPRFDWCEDSMICSYFEGIFGTGFAESENDPKWVAVRSGDFVFIAGEPEDPGELCGYLKDLNCVVIPEDMRWLDAVKAAGIRAYGFTRFRTRAPEQGFDRELLESVLRSAGDCVRVVDAGAREYEIMRDCKWENSFVSNFKDMEDFLTNGFGKCVFVGEEFASAGTTFGWYSGGYELQIATDPKFRRRGLAAVAGAAFVLECMDRGKTPHWDAANPTSAHIAMRLGFVPAGDYPAISVQGKEDAE
ncbi:MAG: GNAT family N-acetyltransferase [Ruminococcus sp.]|nr:GNAT family N-acetyltransferase [Ruminococcus sp.]